MSKTGMTISMMPGTDIIALLYTGLGITQNKLSFPIKVLLRSGTDPLDRDFTSMTADPGRHDLAAPGKMNGHIQFAGQESEAARRKKDFGMIFTWEKSEK